MKRFAIFSIITAASVAPALATPPEGDWENIGFGRFYEDLFTLLQPQLRGENWEVKIEQSIENPGWYRTAPYANPGKTTEAYGTTDPTWIYINASDPQKIYAEDFVLFGKYEFTQVVPECGWPSGTRYAQLNNGVISWPKFAMRVTNLEDMSEICNANTAVNEELALVLPREGGTEMWTPLGEALFTDGILNTLLHGIPATVTVNVEERSDLPGYYRLIGAWQNHGTQTQAFLIDATDPEFVTVPFHNTAVSHPDNGTIWLASVAATYVHEDGMTKEEFSSRYPEYVVKMTDGTISFPGNSVVYNFPEFDWMKFYQTENPAPSTITIPGMESVVDRLEADSEAHPEYYNLQGQRCSRPPHGLCIEKRGSTAKVIRR